MSSDLLPPAAPPGVSPIAPAKSPRGDAGRAAAVVPILLATAAVLAAILIWHVGDVRLLTMHINDLTLYQLVANRVAAGLVPYRDFALEYPPLAIAAFLLPRLMPGDATGTPWAYATPFGIGMIATTAATLAVASRCAAASRSAAATGPGATVRCAAIGAAGTLLLAPVVLFRFDAVPALLTAIALWATLRRRAALAGALLAAGAFVKLYPAALAPLFLLYFLADDDRRSARRLAAGGLGGALAIVVPVTLAAPSWAARFAGYHLRRGVQIESLPSSVYLVAAKLGFGHVEGAANYGAFHVTAPGLAPIGRLLPLAMLATLVAIYAVAYRRMRRERGAAGGSPGETLARAALLVVLAFIVLNKVLSPQFLVWLLPFIGLARPRVAATLLLACLLTTAVFPPLYVSLVERQATWPVALLACRNATLVAALLLALQDLRGRSRA